MEEILLKLKEMGLVVAESEAHHDEPIVRLSGWWLSAEEMLKVGKIPGFSEVWTTQDCRLAFSFLKPSELE